MAFDPVLAGRTREALAAHTGICGAAEERRMFGGLAFLVRGRMCCGIVGDDLMVRLGAEEGTAALDEPHTRPMDFTGRPMRGFVYVGAEGTRSAKDLSRWVERAVRYAVFQPAKGRSGRTGTRRKRSYGRP